MKIHNKTIQKYRSMVDFDFLQEAHGITVVQAPDCPWQFFVTHPDLSGKIAWYPSTGSAVREEFKGDYAKMGKFHDAEELAAAVFNQINSI